MKKPAVQTKSGPRRIFIVDDHPMMRQGLAQLIASESDLAVCGEAESAGDALAAVQRLQPDLFLADITLPGKNGIELIKDLQALRPGPPVLVISMHDESLYAERVLRAGGRGYIMKQEGGRKLLEAIRQVLDGKVYVSEKMSAKILDLFSGARTPSAGSAVELLTDREFEVFQLIGRGLSTVQIARQLHLSPKTINAHRANLKAKLKIKSAPELLRYAVRWLESEPQG